jgi:hypothetical protein
MRKTLESKSYQFMHKSYKVATNYEEQPFELSAQSSRPSKMMGKLAPQLLFTAEVEDLADKSAIFHDFKDLKGIPSGRSVLSSLSPDTYSQVDVTINDLDGNR